MKRRAQLPFREWGAQQLRAWQHTGILGLGDTAWEAVERAAVRYGYRDASAACHEDPTVMRDLFSEAIEDLESPE